MFVRLIGYGLVYYDAWFVVLDVEKYFKDVSCASIFIYEMLLLGYVHIGLRYVKISKQRQKILNNKQLKRDQNTTQLKIEILKGEPTKANQ